MRRWQLPLRLSMFLLLVVSGRVVGDDGDVATIRRQLVQWYARGAPAADTIESYRRRLRPDGSWPDVDYSNKERGGWLTYRHLSRTLAMTEAYRRPDHPLAGKPELRAAILKALAHWAEHDYINPNWWYPRIGVPMTMAPILILMGEAVPADVRERAFSRVLGRSEMGMTGQNKVWCAGIAFMKGLLVEDAALMRRARDEIFSELHVTTDEGIQPDHSFHQHGPQQQWGNYGSSFSGDTIRWASLFRGTDYALDAERLSVLRRYLLEGTSWILWKGRMDISGCGRQIFRNCQESKGASILRQLALMQELDPSEAEAYRRAIAANDAARSNTRVGHKHFWRSDIAVHRRPTWYASVKMSSTRVTGAETCNSENMLGLHLGDGVTYFYRTGREYEDLFPVWDWRRLPGTTCRQGQDSLVPTSGKCRGRSSFVGGVSDGTRGIAAMEYIRGGLRARKSWFFLDEAVVCLGAAVDCDEPESVLTSVNQCVLNGPVTLSSDEGTRRITRGQHALKDVTWVHHDGMGYVFVRPTDVTVGATRQSGNWHAVHRRESQRTLEREVFSVWIDHGAQPHGAQYAYMVLPDVDAAAMPSLYESPLATVLRQTKSVQAVSSHQGQRVRAAFLEPGRLAWGNGQGIEVDAPCLVMLEDTPNGASLYVADPTHQRKTINVKLSGKHVADLTVELPQGGLAGRSVTIALQ